ncbi:family 43 glycosylhydrolase [Microbacterium invictum]|uniref:Chitin-binding type-3 domain-containing protein n=1 Tax=Microbacterium invictum TaxID=515415 RepID=A0AA40VMU5_9MICO|nr:family 43 glycosylhydrolase [Microbacterium invictum]MBB4140791.1 hypothetical protein [Microbacterium invictum]
MSRALAAPRKLSRPVLAVAAALAVLLALLIAPPAHAATETVTVGHATTTTTRGTLNHTYYSSGWLSTSRSHYATTGASFEIVFVGNSVSLTGLTNTGHGIGRVFLDDVEIATVNYRAARITTPRVLFTRDGIPQGRHTLRVEVEGGFIDHTSAVFTSELTEEPQILDDLPALIKQGSALLETDFTAASWPAFASALNSAVLLSTGGTTAQRNEAIAALRAASSALVEVGGLRDLIGDYVTRTPSSYTPDAWTGFANALQTAQNVAADGDATRAEVLTAKNNLQDTAGALVVSSTGEFHSITNNSFWTDTDGNPIYSQGGGVFRFGDTYYWYGVHYVEAEAYRANPSRVYSTSTFKSIPVYSSTDLVNWKFENDVATQETPLTIPESKGHYFAQMKNLADAIWLGRLGVAYNENTGKYTLLIQSGTDLDPSGAQRGFVLFLQGDSPTDDFDYANIQPQIVNSPTRSTGDQTVFTDDDGTDYLIFSNSSGRANAFVSKISDADSLTIEPGKLVGYVAAGREGNAMFKLGGKYYMLTSDLHGWNSSVNHVIESLTSNIQGAYSAEYTLPGTEKDYSHVSQTGFFITVKGTEKDTVIYAGDRWADFAWNGLGYNQWAPISADAGSLSFNSLSNWELNAVTGEWRVGPQNNYILNPDFAADRVSVNQLTGWTTKVDDGSPAAFVSNPSPGADASRFALRLANAEAFSGSVSQDLTLPDGVYRFAAKVNTAAGLEYARVVVTGAEGQSYTLDINQPTTGWASVELGDIALSGGTAKVSVEARSVGGNQAVRIDGLSLVRQAVDTAALRTAFEESASEASADYSSPTWAPFAQARTDAEATLQSAIATQAAVDATLASLTTSRDALVSAVQSIDVSTTRDVYALGETLDAATLTVTATRADGSKHALDASQYNVSGFSSAQPGDKVATVTVNAGLTSADHPVVSDAVTLRVLRAWTATATYVARDWVIYNGAAWLASWWTQVQTPGDPNGPWQEFRQVDGVASWTASRIFVAGDAVTFDGKRFVAKWWTRNQQPGDPNGPWQPTA